MGYYVTCAASRVEQSCTLAHSIRVTGGIVVVNCRDPCLCGSRIDRRIAAGRDYRRVEIKVHPAGVERGRKCAPADFDSLSLRRKKMGGRRGRLRMFLLIENNDPFLAERVPCGKRRGTGKRALMDFRIAPYDHRGTTGEIACAIGAGRINKA